MRADIRMVVIGRWVTCLAVTGLAACGSSKPAAQAGGPPMVRGRGVVVEVNPRLGMATLSMHGKEIDVYWKPEVEVADTLHSAIIPPTGPTDGYVGVYQEPTAIPTAFPGKPGDVVDFMGMRDGEDVYVTRVAVVGHVGQSQ